MHILHLGLFDDEPRPLMHVRSLAARNLHKGKRPMSLHIEQCEREGVVALELKGPLTLGHGGPEVRDRLSALHQAGHVNIVLDLKGDTGIDSTGLGILVFGLARLRKAGGRLRLLNLNQSHLKLFLLTRLAIAFEFFDDEQSAVDSFFPDRALKPYDVLRFVRVQGHSKDVPAGHGVAC